MFGSLNGLPLGQSELAENVPFGSSRWLRFLIACMMRVCFSSASERRSKPPVLNLGCRGLLRRGAYASATPLHLHPTLTQPHRPSIPRQSQRQVVSNPAQVKWELVVTPALHLVFPFWQIRLVHQHGRTQPKPASTGTRSHSKRHDLANGHLLQSMPFTLGTDRSC